MNYRLFDSLVSTMPTLLVVDDEPAIRFSIQQVFEGECIRVLAADNAADARDVFRETLPDVVLLDIRLGGEDGLQVFDMLRRIDPQCLVVFITGHGTSETAIEAMKQGAFDYLVKPLDAQQLVETIRKACQIRRLIRTPAVVEAGESEGSEPDLIIGSGPAMRTVFKQIGRVAGQDINVLILGDSGTGKELVARAIFQHSRRRLGTFLAINCAALPEMLLESELFGHEKGAFTGADRRRIGKFEQAHGGTLFLDEVGDMALSTQAKLLRLLQDGTFERVGGNEVLRADVRIISATNKKLDAMIEKGTFRLDLYYRLRGVSINIPPLSERADDIPELAHFFVFRFNRDLGTGIVAIAEETLERLQAYAWPGNVRELQSVLRESLLHSAGSVLLPEFLPAPLNQFVAESPRNAPQARDDLNWGGFANEIQADISRGEPGVYRRAIEHLDQLLLDTVLLKTQGNQAAAAELLGLSRPTVRAKLRSVNSRRVRLELTGNAAPPPPPTSFNKPDFKIAGNEQEGEREG